VEQNAQYRQSDFAFGGTINPTNGGPGDPPTDPTLKQNITGFIEGRSRAATKLVEDARLGAFPEVGSQNYSSF